MELTKAEIKLLRKAYSVMADTHSKYHSESEKDISEFENKFDQFRQNIDIYSRNLVAAILLIHGFSL